MVWAVLNDVLVGSRQRLVALCFGVSAACICIVFVRVFGLLCFAIRGQENTAKNHVFLKFVYVVSSSQTVRVYRRPGAEKKNVRTFRYGDWSLAICRGFVQGA